jgi:hypothetical protein
MNNNLRDLIIGIGLVILGIVNLIYRDRLSKIPKNRDRTLFFTKEQSRNKKVMLGFFLILFGIIIIIASLTN